ncbi:peptidoglycan-binding protein [Clostridium intestinale]|uniref:peptidoglycan-binding protein n=1 Tax=Clostridium intestinale TaxID=36845 RepID=UPI0009FAB9B5
MTRLAQERLNTLGFNCGTADGIFGEKTRVAVIAFQVSGGLSADGIVGQNTWRKLLSATIMTIWLCYHLLSIKYLA